MAGRAAASGTVEFRLFGRFVVLVDGLEVPTRQFGGRKARQLLRILLTRHPSPVSSDALTEMLWSTKAPRDPAANLAVLVARVRRAVEHRNAVVSTGSGYRIGLASDECRIDTTDFIALASPVRDDPQPIDRCRAALSLWTGDPLAEDPYESWALEYREYLSELRIDVLERGLAACIDAGDTATAAHWSATLVTAAPLRENSTILAMRAFAANGDHGRALQTYERFRRTLADELGVEPTSAAVDEFERLLRAEFTVSAPLRFVGRDRELARLRSATASPGTISVISGRSGSGKSRLIAELCRNRDAATIRCFAAQREEVWSAAATLVRELVAEDASLPSRLTGPLRDAIAVLVPDLTAPREPDATRATIEAQSMRALVVEALSRLVAGSSTSMIVLDDVQWSDESSLGAVAVAMRRARNVAWVVAFRSEEIAGDSRQGTLGRLDADARVTLGGLDPTAIRGLITDTVIADTVIECTDRSPMAIAETLRSLADAGAAAPDGQGRWRAGRGHVDLVRSLTITSQHENLARRLDGLDPAARDVIDLLAILRRETSAAELARGLDRAESHVLDSVARLATADLVRLGDRGWASAHDMIGDVAAGHLDPARKAHMHALAAAAIGTDADPAAVAHHWRSAGDGTAATRAYIAAARNALDSYAHQEATSLADAGLQTAADHSPSSHSPASEATATLHEIRALARARMGDLAGARTDFRAALRGALPPDRQAVVLAELAMMSSGSDDMLRADDLCEMAIVRAADDSRARARALEVGSIIDMNLGRAERSAERAREAMELHTVLGNSSGVARILDARAMATFLDGRITGGGELLRRVADLFAESGDLLRVVTPRSTYGHSLVFADRPDQALVETTSAVELARTLGHDEGIAYALWHRSEALSALGRTSEAVDDAETARRIAGAIGHRGWTATANRALGIAHQTGGDNDAAETAFTSSLDASEHLDLFRSWALSRLAMIDIANGRVEYAADRVDEALVTGPGLGHHEARAARYLLGVARDEDVGPLVAELQAHAAADGARAALRFAVDRSRRRRSAERG